MSSDSEARNLEHTDRPTPEHDRGAPDERETVLRPDLQMPIDQLLRTVEVELIPRLLVAHRSEVQRFSTSGAVASAPYDADWTSERAVRAFATRCVEQEHETVRARVAILLESGVTLEDVYSGLLAPAARYLGDAWKDDTLTFVDVSLGLCAMHRLLCDCENLGFIGPPLSERHAVLLAATPGDQHTFGISMVADLFRRYGWHVRNASGCDASNLLDELGRMQAPIIGLSLNSHLQFDTLCRLVRDARKRIVGRPLIVMVGGEVFRNDPTLAQTAGADYVATEGHKAVFDARAMLQDEAATA